MTAQEWEFVKQAFEGAISLPAEERASYLDAACADRPDLRAVIEQLVLNHRSEESSAVRRDRVPEPEPVFSPGDLVAARFRIIRLIARGGMGEVYEAFDDRLRVRVALKTLRPSLAQDAEAWSRFKREVLISRDVNHPGVCRVYDLIEHVQERDGSTVVIPCMTMKLLEGENLQIWLARWKPVPLPRALEIIDQIANALDALHEQDVIHRDLKPSNVMLVPLPSGRYRAVLTDFGLSKLNTAGDVSFQSRTDFQAGAPYYMAPELLAGQKPSRASDIYALGLIIDEIVTTTRAFDAEHLWAMYAKKMHEDPVPPSARAPIPLPPEWDRVVLQCLDHDPARRPVRARDIARSLGYERRSAPRSVSVAARVADTWYGLSRAARKLPRRAVLGSAALLSIVGIGLAIRMAPPTPLRLTGDLQRLTNDRGLTAFPALAPDGSWFAYASDRGRENLSIWRQSTTSRTTRQLTFGTWRDTDPVISPDGKWIAYRSSRDGGGVYLIPSQGGEPRLAGRFGQSPRFSPDGHQLIYWVADPVSGFGKIYMKPMVGVFEPDQIAREFEDAHNPAFTPDTNYIVFCGTRRSSGPREDEHDIWIYHTVKSMAIRTEAFDRLAAKRVTPHQTLLAATSFEWLGRDLILAGQSGEIVSVWRVPISHDSWKVAGEPERLFPTTGQILHPAVRGVTMLLSGPQADIDVWSLPVKDGVAAGPPQQLTTEGEELMPSVSADGRVMVYLSTIPRGFVIRKRDLTTNADVELARVAGGGGRLKIAPDGTYAVYRALEGQKPEHQAIYSVSLLNGVSKRICADCGGPTDVTRDGHVIYETGSRPLRLNVLRPNGQTSELLSHSHYGVYSARVSPDRGWIAFGVDRGRDGQRIYIAPFRLTGSAESEWQPLTGDGFNTEEPWWSPDGSLLYYLSHRDGFRCIEARRIDRRTGRPQGPYIEVKHFHSARLNPLTIVRRQASYIGLSVAADRLILCLSRVSSNIWMAAFEP